MNLIKKKQYKSLIEQEFLRIFLAEFNRSLMLIVDKDLLITNIISKIVQVSLIERIGIFLLDSETEKYTYVGKKQNDNIFQNIHFTIHSKLAHWLSINETCFQVSRSESIMTYLSDKERDLIRKGGIELVFPLKVMNRLSGFVLLGKRSDGQHFSEQDISLLNLLFDQVAFAIENTSLYEEQSARIKKMYRADRLAVLGQLAAGAVHEIRNPLTAIRSTIQYLGKGMQDPDKLEMVNELMEEVDCINKILQGLLSLSKPSKLEVVRVDVVQLLQQTLVLLNNTIVRQEIGVELDVRAKDTVVTADVSQLKQVFLNVILNAVEAMEDSEEKRLTLSIETRRPSDYQSRYLLISVIDSGKGIEQADLENIFNPFYTTKKDGTGLGLPISYGIISRHGGEMEVNSLPGKGVTVVIKLPQAIKKLNNIINESTHFNSG
ncbi:MAG: GAF domain-containing protein [Dysgonamonadaceae bacterium]|jgi:signal transduction histidine kinase|nr:GAF domain-containing protein [Dysgonamonadaceae bacterium]